VPAGPRFAIVALALLLCGTGAMAQDGKRPRALEAGELRADIAYLADDLLEGRDTGTRGMRTAARYLAARFERLGLAAPPGGRFQVFPSVPIELDAERTRLELVTGGSLRQEFAPGTGFNPHPSAPTGVAEGGVVFAGYGMFAPEFEYDDFYDVDLRDKIALVLRWEPQAADRGSRFLGRRLTDHALLARKVRECAARGARAVLVADAPGLTKERDAAAAPFWPATSGLYQQIRALVVAQLDPAELAETNFTPAQVGEQFFAQLQFNSPLGANVPVAYVSQDFLEQVFQAEGRDALTWRKEVDLSGVSGSFESLLRVRLEVRHQPAKKEGWNVVGILPGVDEKLVDEYVVVGAHYDHVGINAAGEVWNGADDNASGVAALLGLAASFAAERDRPRRSLVFVAFAGEEQGLLGSARFLAAPPVPLHQIKAMVNMDMVGRSLNRTVFAVGAKSSPALKRLVERASQGLGLHLDFDSDEFFDRSDQAGFYYAGVPVVFFNTAEHADYHKQTDDTERIEIGTMADIALLARRVIRTLGDLDAAPPFEDAYRRLHPNWGQDPHLSVPSRTSFEQRLDY